MAPLLITATYNESETIGQLIKSAKRAATGIEVLVVDDDSPDGTAKVVEAVARDLPGVHVLRRPGRLGYASAFKDGFRWGIEHGAEAIVQMDADLSHDPDTIPRLMDRLEDHDMVVGSRYISGGSIPRWTWPRRVLSLVGNRYAIWALSLPIHDATSGFRAYRTDLLRTLDFDAIRADGYAFLIEVADAASRAGARIAEVPIQFVDRELGESKMSAEIVLEAMLLVTRNALARRLPGRGGLMDQARGSSSARQGRPPRTPP